MIFDGKLRGSARVEITGEGGDALLRRLTEAEIPLWEIGFEKGELVFSLGLSDLPDLRVMAAERRRASMGPTVGSSYIISMAYR